MADDQKSLERKRHSSKNKSQYFDQKHEDSNEEQRTSITKSQISHTYQTDISHANPRESLEIGGLKPRKDTSYASTNQEKKYSLSLPTPFLFASPETSVLLTNLEASQSKSSPEAPYSGVYPNRDYLHSSAAQSSAYPGATQPPTFPGSSYLSGYLTCLSAYFSARKESPHSTKWAKFYDSKIWDTYYSTSNNEDLYSFFSSGVNRETPRSLSRSEPDASYSGARQENPHASASLETHRASISQENAEASTSQGNLLSLSSPGTPFSSATPGSPFSGKAPGSTYSDAGSAYSVARLAHLRSGKKLTSPYSGATQASPNSSSTQESPPSAPDSIKREKFHDSKNWDTNLDTTSNNEDVYSFFSSGRETPRSRSGVPASYSGARLENPHASASLETHRASTSQENAEESASQENRYSLSSPGTLFSSAPPGSPFFGKAPGSSNSDAGSAYSVARLAHLRSGKKLASPYSGATQASPNSSTTQESSPDSMKWSKFCSSESRETSSRSRSEPALLPPNRIFTHPSEGRKLVFRSASSEPSLSSSDLELAYASLDSRPETDRSHLQKLNSSHLVLDLSTPRRKPACKSSRRKPAPTDIRKLCYLNPDELSPRPDPAISDLQEIAYSHPILGDDAHSPPRPELTRRPANSDPSHSPANLEPIRLHPSQELARSPPKLGPSQLPPRSEHAQLPPILQPARSPPKPEHLPLSANVELDSSLVSQQPPRSSRGDFSEKYYHEWVLNTYFPINEKNTYVFNDQKEKTQSRKWPPFIRSWFNSLPRHAQESFLEVPLNLQLQLPSWHTNIQQKLFSLPKEKMKMIVKMPCEFLKQYYQQANCMRRKPLCSLNDFQEINRWLFDHQQQFYNWPSTIRQLLGEWYHTMLEFISPPIEFESKVNCKERITSPTTARNVAFLGSPRCGKTSLILSLQGKLSQSSDNYEEFNPTIFEREVIVCEKFPKKLRFIDVDITNYFEIYDSVKNGDVVVLCYAVDDIDSFLQAMGKWYNVARKISPKILIFLVGLKCDRRDGKTNRSLDGRPAVPLKGIEKAFRMFRIAMEFECSSFTHHNIEHAFHMIGHILLY